MHLCDFWGGFSQRSCCGFEPFRCESVTWGECFPIFRKNHSAFIFPHDTNSSNMSIWPFPEPNTNIGMVDTNLPKVESSWNAMAHGDALEGNWRGNWRMEWVASTLHTTSEHDVSSITTADAHTSPASSRLNWRPSPDLNGLVRCAERRNLVSAHVPSNFKRSLQNDVRRKRVEPREISQTQHQSEPFLQTITNETTEFNVKNFYHICLYIISITAPIWRYEYNYIQRVVNLLHVWASLGHLRGGGVYSTTKKYING